MKSESRAGGWKGSGCEGAHTPTMLRGLDHLKAMEEPSMVIK